MWKLLRVGLMYPVGVQLHARLWIIRPFFHGVGVMIDFAVNISATSRVAA